MKIGKLEITASRWPWQGGGSIAPLNPYAARFGGGWTYKLGIDIAGKTIILNLLYGMIRITRKKNK